MSKCMVCGKEFSGWPNAKYCPECRIEHRRKAEREHVARKLACKSIVIGKTRGRCQRCGAEFVYSSGTQKYCPDCAKARKKPEQKPCSVCGQLFSPRTKRQRYCSKNCAKKAAAKRVLAAYHRLHPRPMRVCPVCGKKFVDSEHHYNKYCSPECRIIARRQKQARLKTKKLRRSSII